MKEHESLRLIIEITEVVNVGHMVSIDGKMEKDLGTQL